MADQGFRGSWQRLVEPLLARARPVAVGCLGTGTGAGNKIGDIVAAWKGTERFEGRATLRAWALRVLKLSRIVPESAPVAPEPISPIPAWLEPFPDSLLVDMLDQPPGTNVRYERADSIKLGFVVALQQLSAERRAVLVLRDVIGFDTAEIADMLGITEAASIDALRHARLTLARYLGPTDKSETADRSARILAERFASALEQHDVDRLTALLSDDVRLSMPSHSREYRGARPVAAFLGAYCAGRGVRLLPTTANAQPAFGCYVRDPREPVAHADGLMVLTIEGGRICAVTRFLDTTRLRSFGLPHTLPTE
jgi:DNA-directed RNA polymerase specialized sigma24 family protein